MSERMDAQRFPGELPIDSNFGTGGGSAIESYAGVNVAPAAFIPSGPGGPGLGRFNRRVCIVGYR